MTFDGGAAGGRRSAARTQTTPATSGIHHPAPGAPSSVWTDEMWWCPECAREVELCPCEACKSSDVVVIREDGTRDPVDTGDWGAEA